MGASHIPGNRTDPTSGVDGQAAVTGRKPGMEYLRTLFLQTHFSTVFRTQNCGLPNCGWTSDAHHFFPASSLPESPTKSLHFLPLVESAFASCCFFQSGARPPQVELRNPVDGPMVPRLGLGWRACLCPVRKALFKACKGDTARIKQSPSLRCRGSCKVIPHPKSPSTAGSEHGF